MKAILINILVLSIGYYLYNRSPTSTSSVPSFLQGLFIKPTTVIVVGGGLAGLSAALEAYEQKYTKVILIEKEGSLGGNSIKATSGINAINPFDQEAREAFIYDTLISGGELNQKELVSKLVDESQSSIEWLKEQSEKSPLDLSLVSRCGGHSEPRTHRTSNGPVGWSLVNTLKHKFLSLESNTQVLTNTHVINILADFSQKNRRVKGIFISKRNPDTGATTKEIIYADAVVLATGGFSSSNQLLEKYSPKSVGRPTTNGPWATGDGIELAVGVGAATRDMDQVQIHPTGFVDPNSPLVKSKILAPESLRAYGGILLNSKGQRFVNELATRDHVTAAIDSENGLNIEQPTAYLVLTDKAVEGFGRKSFEFYVSKGLFKKVEGIEGLAQHVSVDTKIIEEEFKAYDKHLSTGEADKTDKIFFPSPLATESDQHYYVALITPVIHYTMGGLVINKDAAVLNDNQEPILGLFGAGEVTGGVHGRNRLAGNSLLECVVYGRTAGRNAVIYARHK